ncbi:histidine kinase [Coraliomargarita sp. W4R53]
MIKTKISSYAQQYQQALRRHLEEASFGSEHLNAARSLGREAVESGLNVLDIVRIHDQAMRAIEAKPSAETKPPSDELSAGGAFLLESLAEVEVQNRQRYEATRDALELRERELANKSASYDELLVESRRLQEQSQQLSHRILLAQEEERREISRELHDQVAQILAGVNVRLAALREIGVLGRQNLERSLVQTQQMIEESVDTVHRFALRLRPTMLDDLGLIPSLRSFIKELPRSEKLEINFTGVNEVEAMDNVRRTVFFRVAQEALRNVVQHADATSATVELTEIPGGIRLIVQDDGKAFQVESSKNYQRLGLIGMKERVGIVGGKFSIESTPDQGTIVCAEIPFLANLEVGSL